MKDIKTFLEYLENIEHVFPEKEYVEGEQLLDDGKVKLISQLKNNWELKCSGRPIKNVKIKLNSKKLNNHSCNCEAFRSNKNCKHLLASYLWIRKELLSLSDVIENTPKPVKRVKRTKNFTKDILSNVSKEEIMNFLVSYARNDKKLNTALTVHFLSKSKHQSKSDFKLILDKIIQPVTRANQRVTASDWSLFFKTIQNMLLQAKDAASISKFDFSMNILITIYDKLYYVISKFDQNHARILEYFQSCNEVLAYTVDLIEAPLRKENYFKQFKEICEKSYFNNYISTDFLHIFLDHDIIPIDTKSKIATNYGNLLLETEDQKIHTYSISLRLLADNKETLISYFNKIDKSLIKPVLHEILEERDLAVLKRIFKLGLNIEESISLEFEYEIAKLEHNQQGIAKKLIKLIGLNRQIHFYELLKDHCELYNDKDSLKAAKKIILSWPEELKIDYHMIHEDYKEVLLSLRSLNELDYHYEYTPQIPETFKNDVVDLYSTTVSDYLDNHVGITTASYIQELISNLYRIHGQLVAPGVLERINAEFGERKSLENLLKTLS